MKHLVWTLAAVSYLLACASASADIGGTVNGGELCTYPSSGVTIDVNPGAGQAIAQFCRWPQEINGSYYIDGYGLYTTSGTAGSTLFGINLSAGGGGGLTGFFCLDDPYHPMVFLRARDPNPPSAWRNKISPEPCHPLDPTPVAIPGLAPPTGPPPGPEQLPPVPDLQPATGAPTNPGNSNPDATENPK